MKIFNVSLRVQITQVAEIPDNPEVPAPEPPQSFNDDPLDKQEKIMTNTWTASPSFSGPRWSHTPGRAKALR